jgi:hypothetical protein
MFSIFHTSFCGSTLLASLLSNSIPTLTEPQCTFNCIDLNEKDIEKYMKEKFKKNILIKFSSGLCFLSKVIKNKKVFIYRKLKDHLYKIDNNYQTKEFYFDSNIKILKAMNINQHFKNKKLNNCSILEAQAHFWIDRLLWILDSENVYFLEYNDFILNKESKLKEICSFFEIEYLPVNINYHVKDAGLNDNNEYINLKNVTEHRKKLFNEEKQWTFNNEEINNIVNKVEKEFSNLKYFI